MNTHQERPKRPCARCGRDCAVGGNSGPISICRDCRYDTWWMRQVGAA